MNNIEQIASLVEKAVREAATEAEFSELINALNGDNHEVIINELEKYAGQVFSGHPYSSVSSEKWKDILEGILEIDVRTANSSPVGMKNRFSRISWFKMAVAASIIIIAGVLYVTFLREPAKKEGISTVARVKAKDPTVYAVRNRATLQLGDGSVISLDHAKEGSIAHQGAADVFKLANGTLVYKSSANETAEPFYNAVSTPRGGQYQLILPDGTKVWLNAASSIRYPVNFKDKQRKVEIRGEVYFEVAADMKNPFVVEAERGLKITVLGTHFNMNTYKDEKWDRTTLLEGSVKISMGKNNKILKRGQQAQSNETCDIEIAEGVDVDAVVAWKNGLLNFNKSDINTVMNQVARWYDVDIKYEGRIPDHLYGGEMQRDLTLQQVLKILEKSGLRFKVLDKTIYVAAR